MVAVIKNEKTREHVDQIVEVLSTMGKAKGSEISELTGLSTWNVGELIRKYIRGMYPDNIITTPKGYIWRNSEEKPAVEGYSEATETTEDRYGYGKNSEGYNDPTASKAMDSVERIMSFRNAPPKPGDICEYENPYYSHNTDVDNHMLVLSVGEDWVCGYHVKPLEDYYDKSFCFKFVLNKAEYYIDARKVFVKSGKAIKARRYYIGEDKLNTIKNRTQELLGFGGVIEKEIKVEVPVEKEVKVEKIVKVEVEPKDYLCYEAMSGVYFKSNYEAIKHAEKYINELIASSPASVKFSDVYNVLGLDAPKLANFITLDREKGEFRFDCDASLTEDHKLCLNITPNI